MSITEFLLARIAEDEAVARAATLNHRSKPMDPDDWRGLPGCERDMTPAQDEHFATWNPARVLAECAAKRAIVEFHQRWPVLVQTEPELRPNLEPGFDVDRVTYSLRHRIAWFTEQEYRERFGEEPPTAPMLRALASVYADHPDYDPSWA